MFLKTAAIALGPHCDFHTWKEGNLEKRRSWGSELGTTEDLEAIGELGATRSDYCLRTKTSKLLQSQARLCNLAPPLGIKNALPQNPP